jgi:hypothetical protein
MAARPYPVDFVQHQGVVADLNAFHQMIGHGDQLVGQYDHLERGGQSAFDVTHVVDQVGAAQSGHKHREGGFHGSLLVHYF